MSFRSHSLDFRVCRAGYDFLAQIAGNIIVAGISQANRVARSPAIMIASATAKLSLLLLGMAMAVVARNSAPVSTTGRMGHGGGDLWYHDILQATTDMKDVPLLLQNQLGQEYALYHGVDISWKSPDPSRRQGLRHVAVTAEDSATGAENVVATVGDDARKKTEKQKLPTINSAKSQIRYTNEVNMTSVGVYDCPDAPGSTGFLYWKDLINAIDDDSAGSLNTLFMLCPTVFVADQPLNILTSNIEIGCVTVTGCIIQNATVFVEDGVSNVVLAGLEFSNQAGEFTIGRNTNVRLIACTFREALFSGSDTQRAAVVTAGRTLFFACHFENNLGDGAVFVTGGKPFFESCRFESNRAFNDNSGATIVVRTANERTSKVSIRNSCFDENQGQYIVLVGRANNSKVILNQNNSISNSLGGVVCQGIYDKSLPSCEDFDLIGTTCTDHFATMTTSSPATASPLAMPPASAPTIDSDEKPWATETDSVGTTNDDTRGRSSLPQDTDGDPPERDIFPERKDPQPSDTESADPLDDALKEFKNSDGTLSIESTSGDGPNLLGTWLLTISVAMVAIFRF